jgi:hypothetical protein
MVSFSGSAVDSRGSRYPPGGLGWTLSLRAPGGSFTAPDHEHPSELEAQADRDRRERPEREHERASAAPYDEPHARHRAERPVGRPQRHRGRVAADATGQHAVAADEQRRPDVRGSSDGGAGAMGWTRRSPMASGGRPTLGAVTVNWEQRTRRATGSPSRRSGASTRPHHEPGGTGDDDLHHAAGSMDPRHEPPAGDPVPDLDRGLQRLRTVRSVTGGTALRRVVLTRRRVDRCGMTLRLRACHAGAGSS